jgi:deazaflavin-dependent oxidoreductase (nitroreductase family)
VSRPPRLRTTALWLIRLGLNPLVLARVQRRPRQSLAVIHHRGRRSGRHYATPVAARPEGNSLLVPLTWGERADWYRNLCASGGGGLSWRGRRYSVQRPELLPPGVGFASFGPLPRLGLRLARIRLVRMRVDGGGADR